MQFLEVLKSLESSIVKFITPYLDSLKNQVVRFLKIYVSYVMHVQILVRDYDLKVNEMSVNKFLDIYIFIIQYIQLTTTFKHFVEFCKAVFCFICIVVTLNILKVHQLNDPEEIVGICLVFTFFSLVAILNEYLSRMYLLDYYIKYNRLVMLEYISYFYELDSLQLKIDYLKMLWYLNILLDSKQFYYNFVKALNSKWKKRKKFLVLFFKKKLIFKYLESIRHIGQYNKSIMVQYATLWKLHVMLAKAVYYGFIESPDKYL